MTRRNWERWSIAVVVFLYVASLVLPVTAQHSDWRGAADLGWFYLVFGVALIPFWFPNLLFIIGVVLLLFRRNKTAAVLGLIATLGAAVWLANASGMGPGYYCWLASMAALASVGGWRALLADDLDTLEPAEKVRPTLPDPAALELFRPPGYKPPVIVDVRRAAPQDNQPSSLQPPCFPSS
jgi:hypothetical protein